MAALDPPSLSPFLSQAKSRTPGDYSEETAREVDCEVRRVIDAQRTRTMKSLSDLKPVLLDGARLLLEKEVITGEELKALLAKHGGAASAAQANTHSLR
jgi:cell division protease FtsH